jgi:hypothetical protein
VRGLHLTIASGLFALSASVAAIVISPGSAVAITSVQCAHFSDTFSSSGVGSGLKIGSCRPSTKGDRTATDPGFFTNSGVTNTTLVWSPSQTTTVFSTPTLTLLGPAPHGCPNVEVEFSWSATVTGGTSTNTHVGDSFTATICALPGGFAKGQLDPGNFPFKRVPGTKVSL